METLSRAHRWQLILGKEEKEPEEEATDEQNDEKKIVLEMEAAMSFLYDHKARGKTHSVPKVNLWLDQINDYFPEDVIHFLQTEAIEKLGLIELMLKEDLIDKIKPNINLLTAVLALKSSMDLDKRVLVKRLVEKITKAILKKIEPPIIQKLGSISSHSGTSKINQKGKIDWRKTIRTNIKHYDKNLKTIVPAHLYFFKKNNRQFKEIFVVVDQSYSMSSSTVYSTLYACILHKLPSLKVHLIAFDTSIVDLSAQLENPVDLIYGLNLGGGTDIGQALKYTREKMRNPKESILFLISDLEEGASAAVLINEVKTLKRNGVNLQCILSLTDQGYLAYDKTMATWINQFGVPTYAVTPNEFPTILNQLL